MNIDLKIQYKKLNSFLQCKLCDGYFRFAHTITECGHTFCKICIINQQKKQNFIKCPVCLTPLEADWKKSIKKDTFKQSLVDTIYPQFQKIEQQVVKRIKEIYPQIDLDEILEEFNYEKLAVEKPTTTKRKKVKVENEQQPNILKQIVTETLSLEFEEFVNIIYEGDKQKLSSLKQKVEQHNQSLQQKWEQQQGELVQIQQKQQQQAQLQHQQFLQQQQLQQQQQQQQQNQIQQQQQVQQQQQKSQSNTQQSIPQFQQPSSLQKTQSLNLNHNKEENINIQRQLFQQNKEQQNQQLQNNILSKSQSNGIQKESNSDQFQIKSKSNDDKFTSLSLMTSSSLMEQSGEDLMKTSSIQTDEQQQMGIQKQEQVISFILHPKTQKDYTLFGLKSSVKLKNNDKKKAEILNIKIFLKKKLAEKYQTNDQTNIGIKNIDQIQCSDIQIYFNNQLQEEKILVEDLFNIFNRLQDEKVPGIKEKFKFLYSINITQ